MCISSPRERCSVCCNNSWKFCIHPWLSLWGVSGVFSGHEALETFASEILGWRQTLLILLHIIYVPALGNADTHLHTCSFRFSVLLYGSGCRNPFNPRRIAAQCTVSEWKECFSDIAVTIASRASIAGVPFQTLAYVRNNSTSPVVVSLHTAIASGKSLLVSASLYAESNCILSVMSKLCSYAEMI